VEALSRVVSRLPADLPAAVFVVLHIPAHSPSQLDAILDRASPLPATTARDGDPIEPGRIYVPEADRHLMVDEETVRVTYGPREGRLRPSVDVLFRSAAAAFSRRAVGVVLSGTLDDGTSGLWNIKDRGGIALVQDPATAMFAGMPESAIRHVDVDAVMAPAELAQEIDRRVRAMDDTPEQRDVPERLRIENLIAREGNGLQAGVMKLGVISPNTCPECHGVLVEIREGSILRYRCHTGHSYSLEALLADVDHCIQARLWDTVRVVEERILLLRQMADLAAGPAEASAHLADADETERRLRPLRDLALDPRLVGYASVRR
jgi:two-component system chemotaxis response regulator CheB